MKLVITLNKNSHCLRETVCAFPAQGTPDDVRTRRYRGTRDVDAAAKLDIGGMDDDLEDSRDSVFSVSTNATEDYAASESAKTLSRQSSTDLVMSDGEDPKNRVRYFDFLMLIQIKDSADLS